MPESQLIEVRDRIKRKKAKSVVKQLFEAKKLTIGQKLIFKPAQDKDKYYPQDYTATIENNRTNCLKREKDNQCYSLSGLRRKIAEELNLADVKANWGFGTKYEWITEEGKSLHDLNHESEQ